MRCPPFGGILRTRQAKRHCNLCRGLQAVQLARSRLASSMPKNNKTQRPSNVRELEREMGQQTLDWPELTEREMRLLLCDMRLDVRDIKRGRAGILKDLMTRAVAKAQRLSSQLRSLDPSTLSRQVHSKHHRTSANSLAQDLSQAMADSECPDKSAITSSLQTALPISFTAVSICCV